MDRFQYLIVMALCVLVTLPLEFLLGARVWRRPKRLAQAVVPPLVIFAAWDMWASGRGTWRFDGSRTIGVLLPGRMALEELVFFAVIPICALLTLEAVRNILDGTTPVQRWLSER